MDKDLHERLRRYLENQLSEEERLEVDQQLQSIPEWAATLTLLLQLRSSARAEVGAAIRQQVDEELTAPVPRIKWLRPVLGIAASFALLLACWWMMQSPVSSEKLFTDSFEVPKASLARDLNSDNRLNTLLDAFNQGDFTPILQAGPSLLKNETIDYASALAFHLGIAQLQNDQAALALNTLEQVDSESNFHFNARWFEALAHLSLGNTQEAQAILKSLPENYASPNGIARKKILKQLK